MVFITQYQTYQRYIYKIHSSRLRKNKWSLNLPIDEARRNDEVIALADSQVLRWIDELNEDIGLGSAAKLISSEIKQIRKEEASIGNRRRIRALYAELDRIQFKPDYLCLIIDKEKDYKRACKGFFVNGIEYTRLLGTNGGIKNSTIVFISSRLAPEIRRRIDNGRDLTQPLVTAKLEAYKALTCSASTPVSTPNGILVVKDLETTFLDDILYLSDEDDGEPLMEYIKDSEVTLNASDGFGLMLPSLARRWSCELGLNYVTSGVNTRFSFEKGMVYTFDFLDFADKIANKEYIVTDAWGTSVDIRNVELILTTSMLKLWDSYKSLDDYINNSISNGYTFGITKECPRKLESERSLNYQFIQSYELDDNDINELISPTIQEITDVLGGDPMKSILFLKGMGLNSNNIGRAENDFAKALMIDKDMINDPFVKSSIKSLIRNRISEAKVGVIQVHGNYSIASGDPYALCQWVFGLNVTGLLKRGEIYNKYWSDSSSDKVVCFRAPMTTHANIRALNLAKNEDVSYWFKHMRTCTIFNAWDTCMPALNGMDFDGDLVMLTDNPVLLRKHIPMPALICAQRKAEKKISTEEDFIHSNIESFGSDIGRTTNYITSMYEVISQFDKTSVEYKELAYRIRCGQLYQQNAIDKAKGIICKPMPREWHDRHAVNKLQDALDKVLYGSIVADKKPYFMRYIYPSLMKQFNTYIRNTGRKSLREFGLTVADMQKMEPDLLNDKQKEFLKYYGYNMPVGVNDCVMNRICTRIEDVFDTSNPHSTSDDIFDYSIMKSDASYSTAQYVAIKKIYDSFNQRLKNYMAFVKTEKVNKDESDIEMLVMINNFKRECCELCSNGKVLCNMLLDMCYTHNSTKRFVWEMCGDEIIDNLLDKNNHIISFPTESDSGDLLYKGHRFQVESTILNENEEVK